MVDTVSDGIRLPGIVRGFLSQQETYWFRPGGATTIAICRVFLFTYLYQHVYKGVFGLASDTAHYYQTVNLAAYYPKSIVYLLFPHTPPPPWFVEMLLSIAAASTLCALVGFLTRTSMVTSVLSLTFLAAFIYSWEPLWSHPYNGGLLAGIAFMFGRAGDAFSVDNLISRRFFGRATDTSRMIYWWPVILAQFGVAAVYFGGFYAKWSTPDFTYNLDWALSDNLRNSIALPWLIWGMPFPPLVELLINTSWLWKLAGLGHLATQALPILSMFSLSHPYLRLAEGLVFGLGVVLLGLVMGIWNLPWILLSAFFVDWEYFGHKLGFRRVFADYETTRGYAGYKTAKITTYNLLILCYGLAFILFNFMIIVTRLDDSGNRAYPFSSMTFYSSIQALKPYSQHRQDPFIYGELELSYRDGRVRKWFCYPNINSLYLASFRNDDVKHKLDEQIGALNGVRTTLQTLGGSVVNDCNGTIEVQSYSAIDLYASILDIPPYPEAARFEIGYRALVGRYERDRDRVVAAAADIHWADASVIFNVNSHGLDVDHYELLLSNDPWKYYKVGPLLNVRGAWAGNAFRMDRDYFALLPGGSYPVVVRVGEKSGDSYDFFGGVLYR